MVRYLKRLQSSRLGRVQAFPMYGGLGMSVPSLHRESTDSLIIYEVLHKCNKLMFCNTILMRHPRWNVRPISSLVSVEENIVSDLVCFFYKKCQCLFKRILVYSVKTVEI